MAAPNQGSSMSDHSVLAADMIANFEKTKTITAVPMRLDPNGVVHLGADGVVRSLNTDRSAVLDYRRLSPEQIKHVTSGFDQDTRNTFVGVDGRDVANVEQLWAVTDVKTTITDIAQLWAVLNIANSDTVARPPWRSDRNGVSHLGADGVLRSLNADRTEVLDYRRLSPEEVEEFAAPFDKALRDMYVGINGLDVTDVERLWAVPAAKKVPAESSDDTPAK